MTGFSANLGFLWQELPLPDAIRAAHRAGFAAVECHWPYATDPGEVRAALEETDLPMLGLNTTRGNVAAGENGLSALPGRSDDARAAMLQALDYAAATGTRNVHVMAGFASGTEATDTFIDNLRFASTEADARGIGLLIEPLNIHDAPGYFFADVRAAADLIQTINVPNLKLMFDCYHMGRMGFDVAALLDEVWPHIGHIQFAGVPDRGRPDVGTLDHAPLFQQIADKGWTAPLGAEYKPGGPTEPTLGWMDRLGQFTTLPRT